MRKLLFSALVFTATLAVSSCDYDDSNDIDVLTPNDSTQANSITILKEF